MGHRRVASSYFLQASSSKASLEGEVESEPTLSALSCKPNNNRALCLKWQSIQAESVIMLRHYNTHYRIPLEGKKKKKKESNLVFCVPHKSHFITYTAVSRMNAIWSHITNILQLGRIQIGGRKLESTYPIKIQFSHHVCSKQWGSHIAAPACPKIFLRKPFLNFN